ncbi:MAG: OmpA family protein [Treponema sp.]|nr:OmpA family protein [Treponema sp.]
MTEKRKTKFKTIDLIIVILCLAGAVFSGAGFWREFNQTLYKLNDDPVGLIIFKKRTAQRRFIERVVWDRLKRTSPVYNGDTIRTTEQAEAIIIFQDETTYLSMDESTMIQVYYNNRSGARIDFSGGNLEVVSENKNVVISIGAYTVVLDGKARLNKNDEEFILSVFDGIASFDGNRVDAGNILAVDSNGEISTKPIITMTSFGSSAYVMGSQSHNAAEAVPVVFSWKDINFDADTAVIVEIAADRRFNRIIQTRDITGASSVSIPLENGSYWWRAYPVSGGSREPETVLFPVGSLEVLPAAEAVLISPAPAEEFTLSGEAPIPLSWTAVENASAYLLEISASEDMRNPFISRQVEENSINQTGLDFGRWYWRVTPVFPYQITGSVQPSVTGQFSVTRGNPVIAAPALAFPLQNGKMHIDSGVNLLSWAYDSKIDSWLVEVADNPGMLNPIVRQDTAVNFFAISPDMLKEGETLYWRVTSRGGTTEAISPVRNFEVSPGTTPAARPVLTALPYLPPIVFGADTAEPAAGNEQTLSRIVLTLSDNDEYNLRVEGHANPTTNPRDTAGRRREQIQELLPLSESRARVIAEQLVELGVARNRIEVHGLGGEYPVAAWEDVGNWWKNRRAEFVLVKR